MMALETEQEILSPEHKALIGRMTALQRETRKAVAGILDGRVASGPQIASGLDSLHVGPLGIGEETGPCVYFVGKGRCKPHNQGCCTSCGYNCVALSTMDETEWLSEQFEAYKERMERWQLGVEKAQEAGVWVPNFEKKLNNGPNVVLVTGFMGSFFSNTEVSPEGRRWLLEQFVEDFKKRGLNPQVYFEVRAEDVLHAQKTGELANLSEMLHQLSARFIVGLESQNEFVRNVIYAKGLKLEVFEEAVRVLKDQDFGVNAFVFMGNHSMGDTETLTDTKKTLYYLRTKGVTPVLMTPSLTRGSFNDLLRFSGRQGLASSDVPVIGDYRFIDPRTYLEALRLTIELFPFDPGMDHNPFMTSLGGGPPAPKEWMMDSPGMCTCPKCAETIKEAARRLLHDFDVEEFKLTVAPVDRCSCRALYEDRLSQEKNWPPLEERVGMNVEIAERSKNPYIEDMLRQLEGV